MYLACFTQFFFVYSPIYIDLFYKISYFLCCILLLLLVSALRKKVFGCIFRQRYLIIHLASLVFFPSNPTGRSVQLQSHCMCQRERCMKLNSSNGSDTSSLYFLRIYYWSWLDCNWRFLRYSCVCIILMRKEDGRMFYWLLQSLKNWCERAYIPT